MVAHRVRPDYHPISNQCDDCNISLVVVESRSDGNPYNFPVVACYGCFTTVREANQKDIADAGLTRDSGVLRRMKQDDDS